MHTDLLVRSSYACNIYLSYVKVKVKVSVVGGQTGKDCLLTWADGVKVTDRRDRTRNSRNRKRCTNHCTTARDPICHVSVSMAQTNQIDGRKLRDSAISHVPLTFGPELALPSPNQLIRAMRFCKFDICHLAWLKPATVEVSVIFSSPKDFSSSSIFSRFTCTS